MPDLRPLLNLTSDHLRALPLLVLSITDGCNSRCLTCDIWKNPRRNMPLPFVARLVGEFAALGGRAVALTGGEAMQHPQWAEIAALFRRAGVKVGLITNGLFLKKDANAVIAHVDSLTVSLDGAAPETYAAIRGVDAFALVLEGMAMVAAGGVSITTRTTVQRANFTEIPAIIDAALGAGAARASFLPVDVLNTEAFGVRTFPADPIHSPALQADDLPVFAALLDALEGTHAAEFAAGQIAESPAKLRRLWDYFAAPFGLASFAPPRCNAPHLSLVVEVDGRIRPCYFLPTGGDLRQTPLSAALNNPALVALRSAYRRGQRPECTRCVCPLHRGARALITGAI